MPDYGRQGTGSARVSAAVQDALAPAARYLALVTQSAPGSADQLLARPDVDATLTDALEEARLAVAAVVRELWGDAPDAPVLDHLLNDVGRQYVALAHLHGAIRHAHASAQPASRPAAVRRAVMEFARITAVRSRLTAVVAETAAKSAMVLAEGKDRVASGEKIRKQWLSRRDGKACHWCAGLHGVTIGMGDSFLPHLGGPADLTGHGRLTQPPRPYRGELQGPPLHPHCRCRLAVVTEASGADRDSAEPAAYRFVTAAQIRALPEEKYKGLTAFLRAAVHELAQALARLRGAVVP